MSFTMNTVVVEKDVWIIFYSLKFIETCGPVCNISWRMFHMHLKWILVFFLFRDGLSYRSSPTHLFSHLKLLPSVASFSVCLKLNISYRKKNGKIQTHDDWTTLPWQQKIQWINGEIKREITENLETNTNKNITF